MGLYRGYIGIIWGYIGIMKKKMETTIKGLRSTWEFQVGKKRRFRVYRV